MCLNKAHSSTQVLIERRRGGAGRPKYVGEAGARVVVLQNNFEVPDALAKWVEHQASRNLENIDFRKYCSIDDDNDNDNDDDESS